MAQGVNIEEIIDIQTEVESGAVNLTEFGTGLLITRDASVLSAGGAGKVKRYGSLDEVAEDFPSTTSVYKDAAVWFAADPSPKALYIGRYTTSAVDSIVDGRIFTTAPDVNDMKSTTASMRVGTTNLTINTNSAGSLAAIATAIQAALRASSPTGAGLTSATVSYAANQFKIDYGTDANIGAPTRSTSPGNNPVHLSDLTGLAVTGDAATTANYKQGSAAETITSGFAAMAGLIPTGKPTAIMPDINVTTDDVNALETAVQGGDYMMARIDSTTDALNANNNTSPSATIFSNQRNKIIPVYSRAFTQGTEDHPPRPDIAIMAKLSSQNFDLPQSIITLVPKALPGVGTTDISATELATLQAKQTSVYTTVGGLPSLLGGWTGKNGVFADSQWWIFWLKSEMERAIFTAMRASKRLSNAQLRDTLNGVMAKAVNSGGAQPGGVVSDLIKHDVQRVTGNYNFDGVMSAGYVLWVDPPSAQTTADRAARISRFKVWVAPSSAIHSVTGGIILSSG